MKKRNVLFVMMVLFILMTATAWASGSSAQSGQITLRFSWWGSDIRHALYNRIADRFEEDYPNIKIMREPVSWNDYFTRLTSQVAGGGAPDIMQMHPQYAALFASEGIFMSLDDPIPSRVIDLSNFTQAAKDTQIVQGRNMMVTIGLSTTGLVVNSTIFQEFGIPMSRAENLTYQSFEALIQEVTSRSNGRYYGYEDMTFNNLQSITQVTMWMRSRGKDFFNDQGKIAFDRDDLISWWEFWARLRSANAVPPPQISVEEIPKTYEQRLFVLAREAMGGNTTNNLKTRQDYMPNHQLVMVRYPTNNGRGGEIFESANIGINAKTRYPEESAMFINYFVNNRRSMELYLIENGFPGSTVMNEYVASILDPSNRQAMEFFNVLAANNTFASRILPPENALDYQRLLENEGSAAAFGQKTIRQAADDFFTAAGRL